MDELLEQIKVTSDEMHKLSMLLLSNGYFDKANKATWVVTFLEWWKSSIEGGEGE